jgi:hypothetical protein
MQALSILTILDMVGKLGQRNVVSFHQIQALEWSVMARARFTSLASLVEAPSFLLPRRIIKAVGMRGTVLLGLLAALLEQLGSYGATSMWRLVALTGLGSLQTCSTGAVLGLLTTEGARVGMGQGELQAAIGNLREVSTTLASLVWGWLYELGRRRQDPAMFYLAGAGLAVAALGVATGWVPEERSVART